MDLRKWRNILEKKREGGERIKGFLKFCPIILGFSEVWESLK